MSRHVEGRRPFEGHHDEVAAVCRAWAPGAVANGDLPFSTRHAAARTPAQIRSDDLIAQAEGILMSMKRIGADETADRLKNAARQAGITLSQAARFVVRVFAG